MSKFEDLPINADFVLKESIELLTPGENDGMDLYRKVRVGTDPRTPAGALHVALGSVRTDFDPKNEVVQIYC